MFQIIIGRTHLGILFNPNPRGFVGFDVFDGNWKGIASSFRITFSPEKWNLYSYFRWWLTQWFKTSFFIFFFFGETGFFELFDIQWIYLLIRDIVSDNQSFFKRFPVSPKNLPWHWTSSMIILVYAIIGNKETRGAFKYGFDWLNKSIISLVFCLVCRM